MLQCLSIPVQFYITTKDPSSCIDGVQQDRINQARSLSSTMVLFAGTLLPYTQYIIYFTSCFMFIPTGRDLVAVGYPLLPGDDKLLPAFCNGDPMGAAFMWKVFGSNFCMLSVVKLITLYMGVVAMPFMIAMVRRAHAHITPRPSPAVRRAVHPASCAASHRHATRRF